VKNTILVIASHPDDEVLGCGGTIKRLSLEGNNIIVAVLGEGITSRYKNRKSVSADKTKKLNQNLFKAAKLIGASTVEHFDLPDNRFDSIPILDIIKIIEKLIKQYKPSIIFTHHFSDLNIDHVITNKAVITATRPLKNTPVKDIYMFEIPSSTEWSFSNLHGAFKPNVFFDIKKTLKFKLKAMQVYESESRKFPHPRSIKALTNIAERWGSVAGQYASESFELLRSIR